MGQKAQTDRSQRGYITIDWMVLVMACIALLFLLGTLLRSSVDADAMNVNGFQELGGDDTLLAFQDFSFDATGWDPSTTSDTLPGIGPVLGPFGSEPVQRAFSIPTDAISAQVTFDLHLIGDWSGQAGFRISLGEREVLTVHLPEGAEAGEVEYNVSDGDGVAVAVQGNTVHPQRAEGELPGANDDFITLRVRLRVSDPAETLVLRLAAGLEGDVARWTLDNFTMVTTSGDI